MSEPVTSEYLKNNQYDIKCPFNITVSNDSKNEMLYCDTIHHLLPNERIVCSGTFMDSQVIGKIFIDPAQHQMHLKRELDGINMLNQGNILTPKVIGSTILTYDNYSILLTEYPSQSTTLKHLWDDAMNDKEKLDVLFRAMAIIADMHNVGIKQDVPHLDNFILNKSNQLYCIDGAAIRKVAQTSADNKEIYLDNIILFFAQLQRKHVYLIPRAYQYYCWVRKPHIHSCNATYIIQKSREIRVSIEKKYLKEVFRNCSEYVYQKSSKHYLICARDYYQADMKNFWNDCDSILEKGKILKNGNSTTAAIIDVNGKKLVVKRYNFKNLAKLLRKQLPYPPGNIIVSWRNANMLRFSGILTPRPIAIYEKRIGPFKGNSYFITEYQEGADCWLQIFNHQDKSTQWSSMLNNFVKLQKQLGEEQIIHGDLKGTNFIDVGDQYSTIDLDSLHRCSSFKIFQKKIGAECIRFLFNWHRWPKLQSMARSRQFEVLASFGDFRIKDILPQKELKDGLCIWMLPKAHCFDDPFIPQIESKQLANVIRAYKNPQDVNGEILKQATRRSISRVEIEKKTYIMKAFPLKRFKESLRHLRYAYREVTNSTKARQLGISTPGYYVYFEIKKYNMVKCNGVIIEDLKNNIELTSLYKNDPQALLLAIPTMIDLYQKGVNHIDITPSNLLLSSDLKTCTIIDWQYCSFHCPYNDAQLIMLAGHFLKYADLKPSEGLWNTFVETLHRKSGSIMPYKYFKQNVTLLQYSKLAIIDRLNLNAQAMGIG